MSRKVSNSLVVVSVFALFSAAVAVLLVGCSEKVTKVNDETVITATLYAPTSVLNGQSVAVNVEVMDEEGDPVSGVEVSFSVTPSTAGHFTSEVATTDDNGLATSVFTATGLGTATIQASAQGAQPKTAQIEVVSTEETTKPIEIEITPSWLPADGISTSIIKATVTDSTGTLVEDSTLVKFVAGEEFDDVDGDGYYTEGIDDLKHDSNQDGKWNPIGTIPAYAFTQNGVAQVDYMAGFRTETAYIKVTAILGCGQIQEDCPIALVPTDSVAYIVWTSDTWIIQVKGTGSMEAAQITATCHDDNGNRVREGFPVEFHIIDGPGGGEALNGDAVNPVTINTNSYGEATVTLLSGTESGTVTLQAKVGNVLSTCPVVTISDGPPFESYMEIEIIPTWLPADGISTSIIKATVTDSTGTLVEDSTLVKFVAGEEFDDVDGDGYYIEGIDNLIHDTNQDGKWNPIGTIPAYAFTQDGVAQVDYMAGFRTGTAYIKVTAILGCGQIQEDCPIVLVPTDSVAFVVLTPDQSSIQVKGTGGMEATHITATCYDDNGNRTGKDFPVEFYILYGPEGGENLNGDTSYPVTINTNSWGQAVVTLLSGTKSGVVRLQARVGGVLSAAPIVTICSGPPFDISVGVTPCNIRGWDINCVEADLCACVVDVYGNPVPDSTSVHFYTDEGMVYCCDQTKAGCAYSTFISADPRIDGIATICAETKGEDGIISKCTNLIVSGPPNNVTFLKYPQTLLADGVSKGDVLVRVLDVNDNFVVNQTPVEMKTNFGSVPSGNTSDGCYASLFETELTSQVLPQDYHMTSLYEDDGIGAINVLTAKSGFVSSSVNVTFLTANTYSKNCEIDIEASVPHGSTVPVVVIIRDRYGNPLGGHYIVADQAHTSGGTVAGSAYTNEFGEATGFTFTATTDPGIESGVVSFCDQDPRGMVCIAVKIEISDD